MSIDRRPNIRVLVLTATIAQKDHAVLKQMAEFLRANGISSNLKTLKTGVGSLKITRIGDVIRLFTRLSLVVRARQVETSLQYLNGEITGNESLMVFQEEYLGGRRRVSPLYE